MIWKKNAERYKGKTEEKCKQLFKQIDELNSLEDSQYGSNDLEESGGSSTVTKDAIHEQVSRLNEKLKTATNKRTQRKAATIKKKLKEAESKIDKYDAQISQAGKRSGYNKTDADASAMMMAHQGEPYIFFQFLRRLTFLVSPCITRCRGGLRNANAFRKEVTTSDSFI